MLVGAAAVQQHERALRLAGAPGARRGAGCPAGRRSRRAARVRQRRQVLLEAARAGARAGAAGAAPSPSVATGSSTAKPMSRDGELEQHAARLAEVDGVEVLAVDDRRGVRAGARRRGARIAVELGVVGRRPRDVVDRPGALDRRGPAAGGRSRGARGARRRRAPVRPVVRSVAPEAERAQQRRCCARAARRRRARRGSPGSACSVGDVRRVRRRAARRARRRRAARARRPSGSRNSSDVAVARGGDAGVGQARLPEVERRGGADAPADRVDHAVAGAPGRRAGELEEREDRAGRADLVAEVQVVDARARRS